MTTEERPPTRSATKRALLEQRLNRTAAGPPTHIPARPGDGPPPLSFAQERVWFMEQYAPGTAAYATPIVVHLRGELDEDALQRALDAVALRHEPLRTTFPATADGRPQVRIGGAGLPVERVEAGPEGVLAVLRAVAARPFDLAGGPLMRVLLARLGDRDHLLALAGHHVIGDGWSSDVLVAELMELYRSARTGAPARLPELPLRYGDFAHWQREQVGGPGFDLHRRYWSGQLAGVPALDLATDRPRPGVQGFAGATHRFTVDAGLTAALGALGRRHGATLFMTLLAAYQALLARHSGQPDFAVGTPVAGRTRPELEGLVGMFVNMLALRADLSGEPSFAQALSRARRTVFDALAHQEVPFEQVVQDLGVARDVSRAPLFQATFALHNFAVQDRPGAPDVPAASWQVLDLPATRFDLELHATPVDGTLACAFTYSTALFDAATITRLAGRFETLLQHAVAAPETPVSRLAVLTADDRIELHRTSRGPRVAVPAEQTLVGLVEAQVARTPDAPAVEFEGTTLGYAELDRLADRVAHRLRSGGAGPGTLVAVCAERSTELVVGLLGVLKSGAAYVPLDPDHPADRLAFVLADTAAPLLLTQRALAGRLPATGAEVLVLDDVAGWPDRPATAAAPGPGPADPAYLIYTSGSTGRPKGVPNTHAGIVNRLDWMQREYGLTGADAVLQKTPTGFDVSVWELFWPLCAGARLVLARPGGHQDPAYLRELIVAAGITTAHFVPSMLAAFAAEDGIEACTALRRVVCSGEELAAPTAARFAERLPGCALHNLYGPTEAAIDVSHRAVGPADLAGTGGVSIGRPIQNIDLHVLDEGLAQVPPGVVGELHIGGVGLARGYWRRPGLTADRFVPDPFGPPGSRLYRTGDRARWAADGALEFLGRSDLQVKLRGVRIEPGEVEARLREQPGVRDAVVVVRDDGPAGPRLVGYAVGVGAALDPAALRAALKAVLPEAMVPVTVTVLDALPVTANGKLDRAGLPAPTAPAATGHVAPSSPGAELVARIWAEVLGVDRVGATDDFFDLGGHSMLATRVVARLRAELAGTGRSVGVMDVFTHRTVAALATLVEGEGRAEPRRLLYELTPPVPEHERVRSCVCLPYGGGSAAVYQPLADALPAGHSLFALAIPGHDVGLDEDPLPFAELAERTAAEVLAAVPGPIVLYGHCGVGGALVVEVARRLEAAGRELEAVYVGAIFPFARTRGPAGRALSWLEHRRSNRQHAVWLKARGVDMDELEPDQADRIIANMRADGDRAEEYFGELLDGRVIPLRAPVVSVVGERDPATDYYPERYREWHFLTGRCAVVVLDEAGHFFLKYRADELAEILSTVHPALDRPGAAGLTEPARAGTGWWLHAASTHEPEPAVQPSLRRFGAVAAGQLVSLAGSALTAWAVPVWILLTTGSLLQFSLFAAAGLIPALLVGPLAGAVVDRSDRRRVLQAAGAAAGLVQLALGLLYWSEQLQPWHLYLGVAAVSVASSFQRLAFTSAIPQLVPKRFLGNANGIAQLSGGFATLLVPLAAAGLLAALGLGTILLLDVLSYTAAIGVLAFTRFPDTLARRRREPLMTEIAAGIGYSWRDPALRAMLLFSALVNLFLGPALILVTPLVLAFADLGAVGAVSFAEALGAIAGGLVFTVWGGPARRRMHGLLVMTLVLAACCVVTGLRPSVLVVAAGVFGTAASLAVIQSIYTTIVQVKVPQRFHGRVFALNLVIAWGTLPLGYAVLAPLASAALQPLLAPGGALAGTLGAVYGVGEGRGLGLVFLVVALAVAALTVAGMRTRVLSRFDAEVPDALPDDLVGLRALQARGVATGAPGVPGRTAGA